MLKESYLFLILFLLIILKEPIYKLFEFDTNSEVNDNCKYIKDDYNKLLEFSKIELNYDTEFINTYIIFKDIYEYLNEITIKGGKDKGFSNNPVIYNNTLVGVINKVNKNSSLVTLITGKNSKISVKINDEIGILQNKNGNLIVSNISNYGNISIGDNIYTSGLGNIKENIYIGKVSNIKLNNKNIEKIIDVDYRLDIKDIDYVTVLKELKWYLD